MLTPDTAAAPIAAVPIAASPDQAALQALREQVRAAHADHVRLRS